VLCCVVFLCFLCCVSVVRLLCVVYVVCMCVLHDIRIDGEIER
jgi:hypothetical protein